MLIVYRRRSDGKFYEHSFDADGECPVARYYKDSRRLILSPVTATPID